MHEDAQPTVATVGVAFSFDDDDLEEEVKATDPLLTVEMEEMERQGDSLIGNESPEADKNRHNRS